MAKVRGRSRGVERNLPNRFESFNRHAVSDPEVGESAGEYESENLEPLPRTQFFADHSRSALTRNTSPDIPFDYGLNPYRGCEHGCVYCYARPTHEYLGLSPGLDFESKIFVKHELPALLRKELERPAWRGERIALSGVTDCYQPAERSFALTRACLEVLRDFRNPVSIITKNHLVTRDIDLLAELAHHRASAVFVSITTLDAELCGQVEPRTSRPAYRLRAIEEMSRAGIPVGVMVAPLIPGLTDFEMPRILEAARDAGALHAGYVPLRLPHAVKDIFAEWIWRVRPDAAAKVLARQSELRGGKLNDSDFVTRMSGQGAWAQQFAQLFDLCTRRLGLNAQELPLNSDAFRRVIANQLNLF